MLHSGPLTHNEIIFTTAFHWKEGINYQVGVCNKQLKISLGSIKMSNTSLEI
ncbi:hypothetical protein HZF08_14990 [Paenibacillus sp. CGMCC 1.16610]|nr:hypothetical protein [Paenibacillus sp. CGMCC 1.16610]